jgi:DNA (cytosine-5)-methyltransferase 1
MRKTNTGEGERKSPPTYPDMKLYQEIIFLDNFFKGKYVVENVIPYYEPLIQAQERGRHLYWCNFKLPITLNDRRAESFIHSTANKLLKFHDLEENWFNSYKGKQRKDKIARNLVDYEAGKTIFETALGIINRPYTKQAELFL